MGGRLTTQQTGQPMAWTKKETENNRLQNGETRYSVSNHHRHSSAHADIRHSTAAHGRHGQSAPMDGWLSW